MSKKYIFACAICHKNYVGPNTKYCSRACYAKSLMGQKRNPEIGRKISEARIRGGKFYRKYSINKEIFDTCDSAEKAYWIGFIMADGGICGDEEKGKRLHIGIQKRDRELLDKFSKFLDTNTPIREDKHNRVNIQIYCKKIVSDLEKYGIVSRKTGLEQIKNIPDEFKRDFIRGYFDGDGCISKNDGKHNHVRICSANKEFLQNIGLEIKGVCGIFPNKIYSPLNKGCHYLSYTGKERTDNLFHYLYDDATIFLERKHARWEE